MPKPARVDRSQHPTFLGTFSGSGGGVSGGRQGTPGFDPGRLRAARLAANLTQGALAEAAGAHIKEVREWESGRRVPQVDAVADLARALSISPLDLIERDTGQALTLQQLRAAAGLNQQQVADRSGLQRTTYSKIERGEALTLRDDDAAAIGSALEVDAHQVTAAHVASRAAYLDQRNPANGQK